MAPALVAWVVATSVHAATVVTSVSDKQDEATGERVISVGFSPAVPPFEITNQTEGAFVAFDATLGENAGAHPELEIVSGHARLRLATGGVRILSVRSNAASLQLHLAGPTIAAESGYRIGPADLISVQVYKNADISGDYSVGPDGMIALPLVGIVRASGRSESELAMDLTKKLGEFLVDPQVNVTIKTYQSQYVYVTGSVPRASRVALRPAMSLNDILSEAGVGLLPGQRFTLTHRGDSAPFASLDSATPEAGQSAALRDGDVITVEEPEYVYIQGEVRHQGRFPLTTGMTLLQAIAVAEGLTDWANKKDIRILRASGDQKREIEVDLRKIESRKAEDPALEPGDYILVKRRIL